MTAKTDSSRLRVLLLFGTRPEIIKLAPVAWALEALPERFETICVATGQHADLVRPFASEFGIPIHYDLRVGQRGQTPSQVCSRVMDELDPLLARQAPGLALVQGDTTSALAGALASFHRKIPVGHVEAGLRSGRPLDPFPEEMNRRLITRLSRLHFAATARNRDTLLAEQVATDDIKLTGNPVVDSVRWALDHAKPSRRVEDIVHRAEGRRLVLLTTHRRESFGAVMRDRLECLADFVARNDDVHHAFPAHPNPEVRAQTASALAEKDRIDVVEPLEYLDFVHLMARSWLVVSDSGGVQEECCSLHKPLLVIRAVTERTEAIESGTARLVGDSIRALEAALDEAHAGAAWMSGARTSVNPFGSGDAGRRIAAGILDYFDTTASELSR